MDHAYGGDWRRLFDLVIVCARKPLFFTDTNTPFHGARALSPLGRGSTRCLQRACTAPRPSTASEAMCPSTSCAWVRATARLSIGRATLACCWRTSDDGTPTTRCACATLATTCTRTLTSRGTTAAAVGGAHVMRRDAQQRDDHRHGRHHRGARRASRLDAPVGFVLFRHRRRGGRHQVRHLLVAPGAAERDSQRAEPRLPGQVSGEPRLLLRQ